MLGWAPGRPPARPLALPASPGAHPRLGGGPGRHSGASEAAAGRASGLHGCWWLWLLGGVGKLGWAPGRRLQAGRSHRLRLGGSMRSTSNAARVTRSLGSRAASISALASRRHGLPGSHAPVPDQCHGHLWAVFLSAWRAFAPLGCPEPIQAAASASALVNRYCRATRQPPPTHRRRRPTPLAQAWRSCSSSGPPCWWRCGRRRRSRHAWRRTPPRYSGAWTSWPRRWSASRCSGGTGGGRCSMGAIALHSWGCARAPGPCTGLGGSLPRCLACCLHPLLSCAASPRRPPAAPLCGTPRAGGARGAGASD